MTELRIIARHAGTVLVGQLAVMAAGVTDTIVAGRFANEALAALSVGAALYVSVFVALMGVLQAQLPVWAELRGAGDGPQLGRSVRQGLYLCIVTMAVGIAALLFPGPVLRWAEVPTELQAPVASYLHVLAAALPAALLFRMFATLNQSLGKPLLVTWLQLGSIALKVPLTIWFVFGGAGLPSLGVAGCAWATLVVYGFMLAAAIWLLRTQPLYRPYAIWQRMEKPDWPAIRSFARLGVPTGLSIMVEVTSFTLMAVFIARMGTIASASHQIAANLTGLLYMAPLSLGIATSARVSYWLGASDERMARLALRSGFRLALLAAGASALIVFGGHHWIASLYANDQQVVTLAAGLLLWVAVYHFADAIQGVCAFVLRSYRIATAPLVVYCVLLWGAGLGGGYMLAYRGVAGHPPLGAPTAFWSAGAAALALNALIFMALLWRAVHARRVPG